MTHKLLLPAFIGLSVTLFACDRVASHEEEEANAAHTASDLAADEAAVRKVEQEMLAAFKAKDAAKLGGYYAEDALLAQPGQAPSVGRAAIAEALAGDMKDPAFSLDFAPDEAAASGDMAYTRGRFRVGYTNPATKKPENASGTYITIFRRQADGRWLVAEDVVTSDG